MIRAKMNLVANSEVVLLVVVVMGGGTGGDGNGQSVVQNRGAVMKNKTKSRNSDHARTHSCSPGRHTRTLTHTLTAGGCPHKHKPTNKM